MALWLASGGAFDTLKVAFDETLVRLLEGSRLLSENAHRRIPAWQSSCLSHLNFEVEPLADVAIVSCPFVPLRCGKDEGRSTENIRAFRRLAIARGSPQSYFGYS